MSFKHHQIVDEHESSAIKIQHWFKDQFKTNKQLLKLKSHSTEIDLLQKTIDKIMKSTSIDDVHSYLSSNGFTAGAMIILKALFPQNTHGTIKTSARHTHLLRIMTSSFMISKFPEQFLYAQDENDENISNTGSTTDTAIHMERETQACLFDSKSIFNSLPKLILSINNKFQKFNTYIHQFSFALRLFNKSFDAWRKADSERLISSLGVTFGQTYSVYIGATNGLVDHSNNSNEPTGPELIIATQMQLDKIRTAMIRVMGKDAAVNRIEEICAAVEAAFYSAATTTAATMATTTSTQLSQGENFNNDTTATSTTAATGQPVTPHTPQSHTTTSSTTSIDQHLSNRSTSQQFNMLPRTVPQSLSTADLPIPLTTTDVDTLSTPQLKVLDKLAQLAGIAQERLAYEMVLNPYYRLPPIVNPLTAAMEASALRRSTSNTSVHSATMGSEHGESSPRSQQTLSNAVSLQDTSSMMQLLKSQMLRVMGDKLVNSLRQSNITSIDQISVGMMVPVYLMPNNHQPELYTAGTDHTTLSYTRTPIQTAKILAIHTVINDNKEEIYYDIEYTCDHTLENSVISSRIVLKNTVISDPTPLLLALQDLGNQIASLTPNRSDIQQEIHSTIDIPLLSQMIVNRALDPVSDLLPILQYLQRSLQALQAPSRTSITDAWIRDLTESFYKVETTSTSPTTTAAAVAVPSSGQSRGRSLDEVAPLLPLFFERATAVIEEIQRDMANYYISVLVPVLQQQQGIEYLKAKFQMRVQTGQISLDATASLLYAQLMPVSHLQNTIKDLTEAGACSEEGFALSDIMPSALGSAPSPIPTDRATSSSSTTAVAGRDAVPVLPPASPAVGTRRNLVDCIVARSIIELMQLPVRLDSIEAAHLIPETLVWDAPRLAAMRDLVDRIALECSLVIACKQVMARYQLPTWCSEPSAEVELQHRLDVLLTESDTSMASITAEVVRYIQEAIQKFRHAQSTTSSSNSGSRSVSTPTATTTTHPALIGGDLEEITERVSKGLKDVVAHGNPVLTLFSKRVYKVLLRSMLGQGYKHLLPAYSLHSTAQQRNLTQLLQSTTRLFINTMRIHREIYTVIIGRAVATATDNTSTTTATTSA